MLTIWVSNGQRFVKNGPPLVNILTTGPSSTILGYISPLCALYNGGVGGRTVQSPVEQRVATRWWSTAVKAAMGWILHPAAHQTLPIARATPGQCCLQHSQTLWKSVVPKLPVLCSYLSDTPYVNRLMQLRWHPLVPYIVYPYTHMEPHLCHAPHQAPLPPTRTRSSSCLNPHTQFSVSARLSS